MAAKSPVNVTEFVNLYLDGETMDALAKRYRADHRTLKRILRKAKVAIRPSGESRILSERRKPPYHGHDETEIVACYKAGASQPELKQIFGISSAYVRKIMARHGVPMRSRSEAKRLQMSRVSLERNREILKPAQAALQAWRAAGNKRANRGQGKRARRRFELAQGLDKG